MVSLDELTVVGRRTVSAAVRPGERVILLTTPNAWEASRTTLPTAAAGGFIAILGAPIVWISAATTWSTWMSTASQWAEIPIPTLFALLSLIAWLVGVHLLLLPAAVWLKTRNMLVLVTDTRVLILLTLKRNRMISLPFRSIVAVDWKRGDNEHGTLIIRHDSSLSKDGQTIETVLHGLDSNIGIETAIRSLMLQS